MHPSAPQNRRTVWGDNELASREANCLLNWPNSLWEPRPEWLSLQGRGTGSPGSQSLAPTMVPQEGFRKCFQPQQPVRTERSAVPTARSWSRSPLTPPPPPPLSHVACEPLAWPWWAARDAWQGEKPSEEEDVAGEGVLAGHQVAPLTQDSWGWRGTGGRSIVAGRGRGWHH